jgi:hypothetical protein
MRRTKGRGRGTTQPMRSSLGGSAGPQDCLQMAKPVLYGLPFLMGRLAEGLHAASN